MRQPPGWILFLIAVAVFIFYGCLFGAILYHYHIPAGTIPSAIMSIAALFLILATIQWVSTWFD